MALDNPEINYRRWARLLFPAITAATTLHVVFNPAWDDSCPHQAVPVGDGDGPYARRSYVHLSLRYWRYEGTRWRLSFWIAYDAEHDVCALHDIQYEGVPACVRDNS